VANRRTGAIVINDGSSDYTFDIFPSKEGRSYSLSTRPAEPGDPVTPWRVPLHPWNSGLMPDRLTNKTGYAKGNCDSSVPGLLLPPPLVNALTFTNATTPNKAVELNGYLYVLGGRYLYQINLSSYAVAEDKDFGVGKAGVDICVFNSELIVAMGETEKVWKRTNVASPAAAWTQATNATYAIALGVVGSALWRAESTNKLSYATTTPLTLTNWLPASPNQYTCGDTTYPVHTIIEFGGTPWALKGDGVYQANSRSLFYNQAPQVGRWPHADNGKGAFVAQGCLWVPSAAGLIRIRPGESKVRGPEVVGRPDYRFWTRGGVEINNAIYLLCTDQATSAENTVVVKMEKDADGASGREYVYHEWARLGGSSKGYFITVSTTPTNPTLFCGYGNDGKYIKLGRGGGRDPDDANYAFGTATVVESGVLLAGDDLTGSVLTGVDVVCDFSAAGETLSVAYKVDGGSYSDMLDTQEGGGSAAITTTNYESKTRYAPPNTTGQFFEIKLTGALTSATGTNRPEIREAYAFGHSITKMTDIVSVALVADSRTRRGMSRAEIVRKFRSWFGAGTVLTVELPEYEIGRTTRFRVVGVDDTPADSEVTKETATNTGRLTVALARVDYANAWATA